MEQWSAGRENTGDSINQRTEKDRASEPQRSDSVPEGGQRSADVKRTPKGHHENTKG